jgi:ribulose 1,5-bisphosphate synthetase/thiazole synthase
VPQAAFSENRFRERRGQQVVTNAATNDTSQHVVILGGGFGGLNAARALADAPVRITLIDRRNHHLFQPLLY